MTYSTQAERDALGAIINEWMPTFDRDIYSDYLRHRRTGMASSRGVFIALTRFALAEYLRGLERARYRGTTALINVWDAWTPVRFEGDLDFLVAPGSRHQQSEQIKLFMTTIAERLIRVEVFRWHLGQKGAIYRVEGIIDTPTDGSGHEWGKVTAFA